MLSLLCSVVIIAVCGVKVAPAAGIVVQANVCLIKFPVRIAVTNRSCKYPTPRRMSNICRVNRISSNTKFGVNPCSRCNDRDSRVVSLQRKVKYIIGAPAGRQKAKEGEGFDENARHNLSRGSFTKVFDEKANTYNAIRVVQTSLGFINVNERAFAESELDLLFLKSLTGFDNLLSGIIRI